MDEDKIDRDEAIFLSIVYSFHAAAMQQLGKLASPLSGKVERDLDGARGTIDVLHMLRKKTEGNLGERERRTLNAVITELQLNYVDECGRGAGETPSAAGEGAAEAAEDKTPEEKS